MTKPLVSFIIPTYNRAHLIGETLESVMEQTYQNWECIVVDDGSQDDSEKIINKYQQIDLRIKFYRRPLNLNKGASSCRNFGFKKSCGNFIQYLDSDDLISPHKLSEQILHIENCPPNTIFCCDWSLFTFNILNDLERIILPFNNNLIKPCDFLRKLGETNSFYPIHSYLVPRKVIELAGNWNEELTNNDDAEFFTRIILHSKSIKHLKNNLAFYRRSQHSNLSSYSDESKITSVIKSWKLIEEHLLISCLENSRIYVENAKQQLFQTIKNRYPRTIAHNKKFFSEQFRQEPYRLRNSFIFRTTVRNYLFLVKNTVKKLLKNE